MEAQICGGRRGRRRNFLLNERQNKLELKARNQELSRVKKQLYKLQRLIDFYDEISLTDAELLKITSFKNEINYNQP